MAPLGLDLPEETPDEMAQCLVEKVMRAGAPDCQVMSIFRNPLSGGPNRLYAAKGEEHVRRIVLEVRKRVGSTALPPGREPSEERPGNWGEIRSWWLSLAFRSGLLAAEGRRMNPQRC